MTSSTAVEKLRAQIRRAEDLKAQLMDERRDELQKSLQTLHEYLRLLDEAERVYAYDEAKQIWLRDTRADVQEKIDKKCETQRELVLYIRAAKEKDEKRFPVTFHDCVVCLESEMVEPQACIFCLSVVGCRACIEEWTAFKRRADHLPCCPRCRYWWAVEAGVLDADLPSSNDNEITISPTV